MTQKAKKRRVARPTLSCCYPLVSREKLVRFPNLLAFGLSSQATVYCLGETTLQKKTQAAKIRKLDFQSLGFYKCNVYGEDVIIQSMEFDRNSSIFPCVCICCNEHIRSDEIYPPFIVCVFSSVLRDDKKWQKQWRETIGPLQFLPQRKSAATSAGKIYVGGWIVV